MDCPKCKLVNPPDAERCDCGYSFLTRTQEPIGAGGPVASQSKHMNGFREKHLGPGEVIVAFGEGYIGEMMGKSDKAQHNGAQIVTRQRVVFYRKGFLGEVIETIPLDKITSIERRSVLGHRTIRLHTSHDQMEFKTFSRVEEEALVGAIERGRRSDLDKPTLPPAGSPAADPFESLSKLAKLRDAGVLTTEEFEKKKAEILAKI